MHTFIIVGLELKLWEFFAASKELGSLDIYFRTSEDFVLSPGPAFISHKWVVWEMNCNRVFVGTLAKEYWSASIGGVYAPIHVLYRLNTGEIPDRLYPGY